MQIKADKKENLLKAALDIFAKKGYEHTTIDDIVFKCKYGKGTFYNYFANKKELFDALHQKISIRQTEQIKAACPYTLAPQDFFYSLIKTIVGLYESDKRLAHIKYNNTVYMSARMTDNIDSVQTQRDDLSAYVCGYVDLKISSGELRQIPPKVVLSCILGPIRYILYSYFRQNVVFSDDNLKEIVNTLMNGVGKIC